MKKIIFFACVVALLSTAPRAFAADLEVSGWIPYWRDEQGIKDATKHMGQIDTVFPFVYVAQTNGTIKDLGGMESSMWKKYMTAAKKNDIEVIPTIMWSDGYAIHTVLTDPVARKKHIKAIDTLVHEHGFSGIDIDYENKRHETKEAFALFLKELREKLEDKRILSCTIEPRTPPDSLYKKIPAEIKYANDYKAIAKYCDRVQIMAYDQQRADLKLNESKAGQPYFPVSDADWVRKVVKYTLKDIPNEKIVLGIPSYGYHYTVTTAPNWYRDYTRIGALNVPDILDIAKEYKVKPARNRAGEMGFTYIPKGSNVKFPKNLKIPKDTTTGMKVAAQALAYANKTGKEVQFRLVSYSDAEAMKQKIDIAKEFDLKGIALFKIDGEEDKKVWEYLK